MKFLALASLATCVASVAGSGPAADGARAEKREVSGSYIPTKAPYDNLWLKVTDEEERDIISFIDRERNVSMYVFASFQIRCDENEKSC